MTSHGIRVSGRLVWTMRPGRTQEILPKRLGLDWKFFFFFPIPLRVSFFQRWPWTEQTVFCIVQSLPALAKFLEKGNFSDEDLRARITRSWNIVDSAREMVKRSSHQFGQLLC